MEWVIAAVVVAVLAVAGWMLLTRRKPGGASAETVEGDMTISFAEPGRVVVTMPARGEPSSPAIARLVDGMARSLLAEHEDVNEVEVRTPDGTVLGTRRREELAGPKGEISALPGEPPPRGQPLHLRELDPREASAVAEYGPSRPLADRLELPPAIRSALTDPNNLAELVEVILRSGGRSPVRNDDVIRVDDQAVVVLQVPVGSMVGEEELNRAYVRFRDSGARRGLALASGIFALRETARRQMMDPNLRHAGLDALQRMADAAAVGADPLAFALPPWSTSRSGRRGDGGRRS